MSLVKQLSRYLKPYLGRFAVALGQIDNCPALATLYDVSDGCITIDGNDLREMTLDSLRRQIGLVAQQGTYYKLHSLQILH